MGGTLNDDDTAIIYEFAGKINALLAEKDQLVDYIRKKMAEFCPNILEVAGPLIGAKLLSHKGTLKALAFMPSSTIQILGAEKALFRHLRSNAKPPKYGYILQSQEVSNAMNKGKAARQLANKISIAAKKDYFSKHPTSFA
jgi:nucleolar protein 56